MYRSIFIFATLLWAVLGTPHVSDEYEALKLSCEAELKARGISLEDISYDVFRTNYEEIEQHNNEGGSWTAGVNCLTLCNEEQRQRFFGIQMPNQMQGYPDLGFVALQAEDKPESFNHLELLTITQPRGQGQCGSCWAFAALSSLESGYIVKTGDWHQSVDFSEQQLVDCTYGETRDSCKGGWMYEAWDAIYEQGNTLVSEADHSYKGEDGTCNMNGKKDMMVKAKLYAKQGKSYVRFSEKPTTSTKVAGEKTAAIIWKDFSVSIAIQAESAFMSYSTGIFNTHSKVNSINHAVTLYGYTPTYFWLQNSWGKGWGIEGNMQISRTDGNLLQMYNYMMYPNLKCVHGENEVGYCKGLDGDLGCLCQNKGLCKPDSTCLCRDGFSGTKCEISEGCSCVNGGKCLESGKCQCQAGYSGDKCQNDEGDCECLNGGECLESFPVQCKCKEGFSGDKCEKKDQDKCDCQNGGSCLASGKCKCKDGYTGDKCEKKGQDDCGCLNGGKCMEDGKCACPKLYSGDKCENKFNCDCQNGGSCLDSGKCKCKEGYTGEKCEKKDQDDCGCLNGGKCMDDGKCACPKLYSGDKCENKFNCECQNGGKCYKGRCKCAAGYYGKECEKKCDCQNKGWCTWKGECRCKAGFTGDKCQEDCGCKNGGTCVKDGCSCKKGWKGDKCEVFDGVCRCKNGGVCDDQGKCECKEGTSGDWCQVKECKVSCENGGVCKPWGKCGCIFPYVGESCKECGCKNNGTCADKKCDCKDGFIGMKCEKKEESENKCTARCKNGRQCYFKNPKTKKMGCRCKPGTYGKKCEKGPSCARKEKAFCKQWSKKGKAFTKKCKYTWGAVNCPVSCGYCKKKKN